MALIVSTVLLSRAYTTFCDVGQQQLIYLDAWSAKLAGNVTALDAMEIVASISRALDVMDTQAAMPGIAAYAEAQHGGTGYNVAAEWTEARAALDAVRAWLRANIPADAITIVQGEQVGAVYAPAVTAPLKALINTARTKLV